MTKGMIDDECLWQQIELFNEEEFQENIKVVSRFLAVDSGKFQLDINDLQSDSENVDDESEISNSGVDENEDDAESENFDDESDMEEKQELQLQVKKKKGKGSIVDDKFFKLSEMEEFLIDQDRLEMNQKKDKDELIDYFANDNDEVNLAESLKYSDFFDLTDVEEEEVHRSEEKVASNGPKSSHELKQERLKNKIARMEESMLENKSWQMKGEVKADNRPQNSLLEETLEFESTTRPAPIITEKVTIKLEDIIRQRIKDKAFDDVERKIKPSDIQYEYKKQLVLDQEKSKQSLAQVYEKEYLKELDKHNPNAADEEEVEPKEHKEIRALLKDLFENLDLLSNFHYTPRPAQSELKIITNLPSIAMEEVAPASVSNATMLAPEEIKAKPIGGNVIGTNERTDTDKNRERRHKKVFQRKKFTNEKSSNKNDLIAKVTKSKNVEKVTQIFFFFIIYLIKLLFFCYLDENC